MTSTALRPDECVTANRWHDFRLVDGLVRCAHCGEDAVADYSVSERWREEGVHWHLFEERHTSGANTRFEGGALTNKLANRETSAALTPEEAADWMESRERSILADNPGATVSTSDDPETYFVRSRALRVHFLSRGGDCSGGVRIGSTYADLWAVPMPLADCPRHRPAR